MSKLKPRIRPRELTAEERVERSQIVNQKVRCPLCGENHLPCPTPEEIKQRAEEIHELWREAWKEIGDRDNCLEEERVVKYRNAMRVPTSGYRLYKSVLLPVVKQERD